MLENVNLIDYFSSPVSQRQKQYEVIRSIVIDKLQVKDAACKFGYKSSTVFSLLRDSKCGRVQLFPKVQKGPLRKRTSIGVQEKIIEYRKQGFSASDIELKLKEEEISISARTIERVLKDGGFGKLQRRTNKELGKTVKNKIIPLRSGHLDFMELEPFTIDCSVVGIFFFIPYIIESGIIGLLEEYRLPESSDIGSTQACLSTLFLKLIGNERLSHIGAYDKEPGLGIFAGLNILPKPTYITTYSCRCSETQLMDLQSRIISHFKNKFSNFYCSDYINLDFHSIPHYGDESEMEKLWCGSKGKSLKGANTVFATDGKSNAILYTRADILRRNEAQEVKKFVNYWRDLSGAINETLVFDCRFTSYKVLDDIENDGHVKFITLRKRNAKLVKETLELPQKEWKKVYVPIPKRKYKNVSVYESEVKFKNCKNTFRQIAIKDHGRNAPTFIITNNKDISLKDVLEVYAKRWRIENKLSELVAFFNLNALSSPVMVRIHFDILWTMVADTLYHIFAQDLKRFENNTASTLFKKFINMPGKVIYKDGKFTVKIRKRAHTPILKEVKKLQTPFNVPWLAGKSVEIIWTA